MGRIIVSENISLDGVVADPTGEEGFRHGGWFTEVSDQDRAAWGRLALEEALGAEALLLGRRSYQFFAARWPSRTGALADSLNRLPKYVVSSTLDELEWNNSAVLAGDAVTVASELKDGLDGEIVVLASFQLARVLIERDLVDQLRLTVFPVLLGTGERLFGETADKQPLRLADTRRLGDGLAHLTYELVRR